MNDFFDLFARKAADVVGSGSAFILSILLVLIWLGLGPFFNYSDTWQLLINTLTTVLTFLIVFLIQHTQNHDTKALQIKLDELIRIHQAAHNSLIDLDKLNDEQLKQLEEKYKELSQSQIEEPRQ